MIYVIITLIVLLIASIYGNYNLIRKNEILNEEIDRLTNFIQTFSDNLSSIDTQLNEIDTRGSFSSDDEIGYTYKTIKLIISKLQNFNINYGEKKKE